jgi:hypothetical protein
MNNIIDAFGLQGKNVFVAGIVIEASEMIEPPHMPDN